MTHMMSMADLVAPSVETHMIDSGCYLKKEYSIDSYEFFNSIMSNFQLG